MGPGEFSDHYLTSFLNKHRVELQQASNLLELLGALNPAGRLRLVVGLPSTDGCAPVAFRDLSHATLNTQQEPAHLCECVPETMR